MKVKFKKLNPEAVIPKYAKPGDAGLDLTAISVEDLGNQLKFTTGLAVEIPKGYVGLIFPRSSIFKTSMRLSNCVGVIDSGYRGDLSFFFDKQIDYKLDTRDYISNLSLNQYKPGDRVGQLIIMPFPEIEPVEADSLSDSERGTSGWGSTGA